MAWPKRVVVTGGSGLLGTAVVAELARHTAVLALGHRAPFPGVRLVDLTSPAALRALEAEAWDGLVNCAAYRSPDFCEQDREAARRLNADLPAALAALAAARGARLVHISTDYVFPGTRPPYREEDPCEPVNYYGETKRLAEEAVLQRHPAALVLRIPALYGEPPAPLTAPLVEEGLAAARAAGPVEQDDVIVRFPTNTADVAAVVAFALEQGLAGRLHASAGQCFTRYAWARWLAELEGRDPAHIRPARHDPSRKARRPRDCQLAVDRLRALGGPVPRDAREWLPGLLARRAGR
jgi:dTDP-4-dehydrorhamnose reductase